MTTARNSAVRWAVSLIRSPARSLRAVGQAIAQASPKTPPKNIPYVIKTAATSRCCWRTVREASSMDGTDSGMRSPYLIQIPSPMRGLRAVERTRNIRRGAAVT